MSDGKVEEYIGYDQWNGAAKLARYTCDLLHNQGSVYILMGIPGFHSNRRTQGYKWGLQQNCPGVTVVGEQTADWDRTKAIEVAKANATAKFDETMEWLARTYVHAMNCIHYMHDKYFYERLEMALHDRDILRTMAFGIAGLSVVADSLSAIKYGKMRVTRDETGLIVDYQNEGNKATPQFGNNDDRVDKIASDIVTSFMGKIRKHPTYRDVIPLGLRAGSILTLILLAGLIAYILINFDAFFLQFHQLFFEGDSFAFRYDDTLVRLYPEQLWNDAAILIGVLTGVMAVALIALSSWWLKKVGRTASHKEASR